MNLQYVTADQSDIPQVFLLAKQLIECYEDLETIDLDKVLQWVNHKLENRIRTYTKVLLDNVVCGYYCLSADGELDDFYVLPEFRNRGIGSQILKECIGQSREPVYLYVFTGNIRAIALYERFGFSIAKRVGKTRLIMCRNG